MGRVGGDCGDCGARGHEFHVSLLLDRVRSQGIPGLVSAYKWVMLVTVASSGHYWQSWVLESLVSGTRGPRVGASLLGGRDGAQGILGLVPAHWLMRLVPGQVPAHWWVEHISIPIKISPKSSPKVS